MIAVFTTAIQVPTQKPANDAEISVAGRTNENPRYDAVCTLEASVH